MSHKAARQFLEKANKDTSWREKNLPSAEASWQEKVDAALRVGPKLGYEFTAQELKDVENVKAFWRKASEDSTLQAKLRTIGQSGDQKGMLPALSKIATEAGFAVTPALLEEVTVGKLQELGSGELSEADLEKVAGGATSSLLMNNISTGANLQTMAVQSTIMCPW
jgi:predicted ribosomally synthesized peptide with nif11-like leader